MNEKDLEQLRTYEPVLRFAESERFFPMDVDHYLEKCQLFPSGPQGVVDAVAHLQAVREKRIGKLQSEQFYLRFVNNPIRDADAWIWWGALSVLAFLAGWFIHHLAGVEIAAAASLSAALVIFMLASPMRLRIIPAILTVLLFSALEVAPIWFFLKPRTIVSTRVEYLVLLPAYIVALFYLSIRTLKFILDRIVPEAPGLLMDMLSQATDQVAREAYRLYAGIVRKDPQPVYYGRVLHETGPDGAKWTVLQYHFFYAFNDWRIAANGLNHHEGDWELVSVYLREDEPYAVLFSQHLAGYMERWENVRKAIDEEGRLTQHPLVYVALGSHANYSRPEVIRSPSLYHRGPVQRFAYWLDGLIHFLFLLFNPDQKARQIALDEIYSRPAQLLNEDAFAHLRDEQDHYIVSLPVEIASGDGFRAGCSSDVYQEGMIISSSYLKRDKSDREVTRPASTAWRAVSLNPEPEWVEYKGRWGVKSLLENESGPPGPKWERALDNQPPEIRLRWGKPLDWLKLLEASGGE